MILITGGTGFVGRHLIDRCTVERVPLRVLSRRAAPAALPPGVTWSTGDLTDVTALRGALIGVRTIIHAAAMLPASGANEAEFRRVNVTGTSTLAGLAQESGVGQFVFVSTAGVYGEAARAPRTESDATCPADSYSRTKLEAELAIRRTLDGSGVRWTILRPSGLYAGDREETATLVHAVATRRLWLHGPTRVVLQPTHVDDVVRAALAVARRDDLSGEVLNIGGSRTLAYQDLISLIGARVGHTPLQVSAPRFRTVDRSISIERARRVIAFEPMPLDAGLDATVAELRRVGRL